MTIQPLSTTVVSRMLRSSPADVALQQLLANTQFPSFVETEFSESGHTDAASVLLWPGSLDERSDATTLLAISRNGPRPGSQRTLLLTAGSAIAGVTATRLLFPDSGGILEVPKGWSTTLDADVVVAEPDGSLLISAAPKSRWMDDVYSADDDIRPALSTFLEGLDPAGLIEAADAFRRTSDFSTGPRARTIGLENLA